MISPNLVDKDFNFDMDDLDELVLVLNKSFRIRFPGERNVCHLYLRVDPFLYQEIYENEGNRVYFFIFKMFV